MNKKSRLSEIYQNYQSIMVKDVNTLEEFLDKYLIVKAEYYNSKNHYFGFPIETYEKQLENQGFSIISGAFSKTGKSVSFYK